MSPAHIALLIAGLLIGPATAEAARFRRPFDRNTGVNFGFDNDGNRRNGRCTDYACRGSCYDGHRGTDFPVPRGTAILAAAPGTVVARETGCPNEGWYNAATGECSSCGSFCGNYLRLRHDDGTETLYCHLKSNVRVSMNQRVSCGQHIADSGNSGCSTGPHLHFGFRRGGVNLDAFDGNCSSSGGVWVDQGGHPGNPTTRCEVSCQCNPGQRESGACGRCGQRTRSCGSNCRWGAWSGCSGQGACTPGERQQESCCDCGSRVRSCSNRCAWGAWSQCAGADPAGAPACETGEPGLCAQGRMRCAGGCLSCVPTHNPEPELCDGLDNDCDGEADEDAPQQLSDPPPDYAARLLDLSHPLALYPHERAETWALFENVGAQTWPARSVWLRADGLALRDPEQWPAHDVAAVIPHPVAPGEQAAVRVSLQMPGTSPPALTLTLEGPGAEAMRCPSPGFTAAVAPLAPEPPAQESEAIRHPLFGPETRSSGCAASSETPSFAWLLVLSSRRLWRGARRRLSGS